MADTDVANFWTDEQWSRIRQVAVEEARAARVAGNVLPIVGPLEPDALFASASSLIEPNAAPNAVAGYSVDDATGIRLATLQTKVFLRDAQLREPKLASAMVAFRRAANVLARLEDEIVFNGQPGPNTPPPLLKFKNKGGLEVIDGQNRPGLADGQQPAPVSGEGLVGAVSSAIGALEARFQTGPFACILGTEAYRTVQSPNFSFILAQDRILPLLNGGPLVRSPALNEDAGMIIALGAALVELVLATDVSIEFLQTTEDAWFVFRVYEKMVLRIKDGYAIEHLKRA